MWFGVITLAITVTGMSAAMAAPQDASADESSAAGTTIIVRPPATESERRQELREFTKQIVRPPRMHQPIAKFFFPVCPQVRGLAAADAEVIAERMRQNARALGIGANEDPKCAPTILVAFMSPAAGPPEKWLSAHSPQLAHLAARERERVLSEAGPVRAWNRVEVRDFYGQPQVVGETTLIDPQPKSKTDPIVTTEITGAAVLIARDAAEGLTLAQLADYATMRTLIGSGAPPDGELTPVETILSLFEDADPPVGMTSFDKALVAELYNASQNSSARRVYNDIAAAAVRSEVKTSREE